MTKYVVVERNVFTDNTRDVCVFGHEDPAWKLVASMTKQGGGGGQFFTVERRDDPIVQDFLRYVSRWQSPTFSATTRWRNMERAAACLTIMTAAAKRAALNHPDFSSLDAEKKQRLLDSYSTQVSR